ncbi:MAG: hypothetical protein COB76_05420 [Alphaproteobacteria bacterium]|nr:MAG: hypothetical protein COB76_05420 [Alphaproteobacteria bacterium]
MKLILLLCVLLFPNIASAQVIGEVTKLPVPRFVSIRSDRTYARTGPGTRYPIKWVYQKNNMPVEITQEFDTWRKIRDVEGEEGWVHQSLLSGKRFAVMNESQAMPLLKSNDDDARPVALIESGAILRLESCKGQWCEASASGFNGWISYDSVWGVYEGEEFD